ncbi:MAG: arginine--tRNA ligase, partial [Eggerthellaceae bacterium]|nr:arginine--tRNA ligase [Eggerthellaceae bacterium]
MQPRDEIEQALRYAVERAIEDKSLALDEVPEITLERPRDEGHGDWACTIALRLAKQAHLAPRDIANIILEHMQSLDVLEKSEIAGPGFINFYLSNTAAQSIVATIRTQKEKFGKQEALPNTSPALIEYISANPTGPMHVGHGRWAALGSALANIMRHTGVLVDEEFYINDHGVQMKKFGLSIQARYEELLGRDVEVPEGGYNGAYVKDIAQALINEDGDIWIGREDKEALERFTEFGYAYILKNVQEVCDTFDTHFDFWQSERELYVPQKAFDGQAPLDFCLQTLKNNGDTYEKEGALWFASSKYGDEKDRVLKKA